MAKIEAPNKSYNGPGPGGAVFVDGKAETDEEAALNYYRSAGYKVGGSVDSPRAAQEVSDPRDIDEVLVGTRLRDAAVDPRPDDFLAPIGAGEANPHGAAVVSPEVHGSGPAGIRPGAVRDNLGKQEVREKEFAAARLVQRVEMAEAVAAEIPNPDDRGPIGLSDPGSVAAVDSGDGAVPDEVPKASDNKAAWVDHAVSQGVAREDAESMTKADLVEQYG